MKQEAVRFGQEGEMVGILAVPARPGPLANKVLLVWNTGIAHRIGPHRINVDLARGLTAVGLAVFRFDLSGRGDSSARQGEAASPVADVQEAMAMLEERYGYHEFILHGLCSGAVEAHEVARVDPRVIGLSMVDTYAYRCGAFYWHYLRRKLCSTYYWRRLVRSALGLEKHPRFAEADLYFKPYPSLASIRSDFTSFVARRLPCLVVYTNGYDYVYNHREQFYAMLRGVEFHGTLSLEHHADADHMYTLTQDRQRLVDLVCRWVLATATEPLPVLPSDGGGARCSDAGGS